MAGNKLPSLPEQRIHVLFLAYVSTRPPYTEQLLDRMSSCTGIFSEAEDYLEQVE